LPGACLALARRSSMRCGSTCCNMPAPDPAYGADASAVTADCDRDCTISANIGLLLSVLAVRKGRAGNRAQSKGVLSVGMQRCW
jgi:hypothetical protein